jgi:hypothetical protein
VNGKVVENAGRSAQSILNAICEGFKNKPAECDAKLSNENPSSGFGYGTTNAPAGGGCGA